MRHVSAFPHDPSAVAGIEALQTHISHLFLTGDHVYKFRKAVDLGFLDFTRRSKRLEDCLREVALNRRLAPDGYLGVALAHMHDGRVEIGACAETVEITVDSEPCVVMRRLPAGRDAHSLLDAGELRGTQIEGLAERIAAFHEANRICVPKCLDSDAWLSRVLEPVLACLEVFEENKIAGISRNTVRNTRELVEAALEARLEAFEARRKAGRFVDGHGDLHLGHCWFERDDAAPIFIDCIEFRDDFRQIDPASEVAFLAMDLFYRHRPRFAERFLRSYARASDDFDLYRVVDFFMGYRALVRAKVAALTSREPDVELAQRQRAAGSARRHLRLAQRLLSRRPTRAVVLVSGIVGSGKTTAAEVIADHLAGVVISSDRVRKRMAGLEATARAGSAWREGIYGSAQTDAVYSGLLERARTVVDAGRVAVLDATFARQSHRDEILDWAQARALPTWFVEVRCGEEVTLQRLARRKTMNRDASDAGPELYALSAKAYEAIDLPRAVHWEQVQTDRRDWRGQLRKGFLALSVQLKRKAG